MDTLPKSLGNVSAVTLNSFFEPNNEVHPYARNMQQKNTFSLTKAFSLTTPEAHVNRDPKNLEQDFLTFTVFHFQGTKLPEVEVVGPMGVVEHVMYNPAYDEISSYLRDTKALFLDRPEVAAKKFMFAGTELTSWEAATLLRYSRLTINSGNWKLKGVPLRAHVVAVLEMLPTLTLMETILVTAEAGAADFTDWVKAIPELRSEPGYNTASLHHVLNENIKPKDAKDFIGIPDVWLEELFED